MDPEEVRRFADELNRFNTDLENRLVLLQARFTSLGDTWQDQEHEKFADEFRTAMKALKKFVELSKAHTALPVAQGPAHRGISPPTLKVHGRTRPSHLR